MDESEFDFILSSGEGQFVEFKESLDKSLAKEIVAFANSQGGRIFLGISDKNEPKGINITNELKSQIIDIASKCDPSIKVSLEVYQNILIVSVDQGLNRPYSCSTGFYLRTGSSSPKLSRDEIFDFAISEGKIKFDEQLNYEFRYPEDFDEEKLLIYLELSDLTRNISFEDMLINLKVARLERDVLRLNNAGVLFFAKNPERFFFTSKVICVNYLTDGKADILDRKIFDEGIISNIVEAENYVTKHIDVKFEIESLSRKEIPAYPKAAYREAIVNAIMHRDYFQSGDVLVEVFKNKILVSNPGGLVKWLDKEDLGKYSRPRNPLIAELLSKTEYVEKLGSGINRMITAMEQSGLKRPRFEHNQSFMVVMEDYIFVNAGVKDGVKDGVILSLNQKNILKKIKEKPDITAEKLSEIIGINKRNIEKNLSKLSNLKIIERVGSDKGGYWKIR